MNSFKVGAIVFGFGFIVTFTLSIVLFVKQIIFINNSVVATATITRIDEEKDGNTILYRPTYSFIDYLNSNHEYTSRSASSGLKLKVGDQINVRYIPSNYSYVSENNTLSIFDAPAVFLIISLFMAFFSIGFYYNSYYKEFLGRRLKKNGKKVTATVKEIKHQVVEPTDWGKSVPYEVVATWIDETINKEYVFKSKYLQNDPSTTLEVGSKIDVYVDSQNYSNYYLDTGDLV